MRKGILGSIAALAAGAGSAWGQDPMPAAPAGDPPPPAAVAPADGGVIPANGPLLPPGLGPTPPAPVIMPPIAPGPYGDPQGLGPVAGFGPPPGPMYPNPGPYAAPLWQPSGPGHFADPKAGAFGAAPRAWTSLEYLMWFARGQQINYPLVTTSAPNDLGLPGRASTLVLAGNETLSYNAISGFRVSGGMFCDCDRRYGFEASGFLLEQKTNISEFASSPSGIPLLARPFRDTATPGINSTILVATPSIGNGQIRVADGTQTFSVEANGVLNLYRAAPDAGKLWWSLDVFGGYRFLQVEDQFEIDTATQVNIAPTVTPVAVTGPFGQVTPVGAILTPARVNFAGLSLASPATLVSFDRVHVYNRFNGGQVGVRGESRWGMYSLTLIGKIAAGQMQERIEITGGSAFAEQGPLGPGRTGSAYGGLYANASNIGRYNNTEFTIIPEVTANFGIAVTRGLTAFVGYNYLYIDKLARAADQFTPVVNSAQVPASPNYGAGNRPLAPAYTIVQDRFWLMGVNFGLQLRY